MGSQPLRFTIEMDADASPIAGRLRPEGAEIPFVGWIGLAGALEQILDAGRTPGSASTQSTPSRGPTDPNRPKASRCEMTFAKTHSMIINRKEP